MAEQASVVRDVVVVGGGAAQHINADLVMEDLDRAVAARADAPTKEGDAR